MNLDDLKAVQAAVYERGILHDERGERALALLDSGVLDDLIARVQAAEAEVERLNTEPMAAFESRMADENDRLRRERNEWLTRAERAEADAQSFRAFTCSCGHARTSHTPKDFGDCTECPHGTCSNTIPGLKWDIWHRDTLSRADWLDAQVTAIAADRDATRAENAHLRAAIGSIDSADAGMLRSAATATGGTHAFVLSRRLIRVLDQVDAARRAIEGES